MAAACSSLRTVVMTRAPNAFAMGMTTLANPPAPAIISSVSPALSLPSMNRNRYAAPNTSGSAAASSMDSPFGMGMSISAGTATYSA